MTDRRTLRGSVQAQPVSGHHFSLEPPRKKAQLRAYFTRNGLVPFLPVPETELPLYCSPREGTYATFLYPGRFTKVCKHCRRSSEHAPANGELCRTRRWRTRIVLSTNHRNHSVFQTWPRLFYPWNLSVRRCIDSYTDVEYIMKIKKMTYLSGTRGDVLLHLVREVSCFFPVGTRVRGLWDVFYTDSRNNLNDYRWVFLRLYCTRYVMYFQIFYTVIFFNSRDENFVF